MKKCDERDPISIRRISNSNLGKNEEKEGIQLRKAWTHKEVDLSDVRSEKCREGFAS